MYTHTYRIYHLWPFLFFLNLSWRKNHGLAFFSDLLRPFEVSYSFFFQKLKYLKFDKIFIR